MCLLRYEIFNLSFWVLSTLFGYHSRRYIILLWDLGHYPHIRTWHKGSCGQQESVVRGAPPNNPSTLEVFFLYLCHYLGKGVSITFSCKMIFIFITISIAVKVACTLITTVAFTYTLLIDWITIDLIHLNRWQTGGWRFTNLLFEINWILLLRTNTHRNGNSYRVITERRNYV